MSNYADAATDVAETYYDSEDADTFYQVIWGGEDIHVGLYDETQDISEASRRIVQQMAGQLQTLEKGRKLLDLGSGYGGGARYLARTHGVHVTCLNLSDVENARNRTLTEQQGLTDLMDVVHGAFEDIPAEDESFDIAWSQDAFLHSGERARVLKEVARVLKPGGELIFTDPMQADGLTDTKALQPIYDRLHLPNLASFEFYREELGKLGFEEVSVTRMAHHLTTHYGRVAEELSARRSELEGRVSSDYIDRMLTGLDHWVRAGGEGKLAWGILHFRKTA